MMSLKVGCIANDEGVLGRILAQSEPEGLQVHVQYKPTTAAIGLNKLLDDGCNVLVHQDVWIPPGFMEKLPSVLAELPESWVVAGIYGHNRDGFCGHIHDRRVPRALKTNHVFPQDALSFDECCLFVNPDKGFRFDEGMGGFDLYGTYAALRARELGTAWIIDCPVEHYATRSVDWRPSGYFFKAWQYLHHRFPNEKITSTVYGEKSALAFKDKYKGQTAWIIGKGNSLRYLKKEDIGAGVVIVLNDAINSLPKIPNNIFSMQKDGGGRKNRPAFLDNKCDISPNCDGCSGMVRPDKSIPLLLHKHESLFCFPDHPHRYIFSWEDLGLPHNEFSFLCAIKIAQMFGCEKFKFVSFDAHAVNDLDYDSLHPRTRINLLEQKRILPEYIKDLDVEWITPKRNERPVNVLTNRYKGKAAYIVGRGASLERLTKDHFDDGFVITLNEAIVAVEILGLNIPVYSMQKDGGMRKKQPHMLNPDCDEKDCYGCAGMVEPKKDIPLLLHACESLNCFPTHPERYIFDYKDYDLKGDMFSLLLAIHIAKQMGAEHIKFVCCDVHATGDYRTFTPGYGTNDGGRTEMYLGIQKEQLTKHLNGISHEFVTP